MIERLRFLAAVFRFHVRKVKIRSLSRRSLVARMRLRSRSLRISGARDQDRKDGPNLFSRKQASALRRNVSERQRENATSEYAIHSRGAVYMSL